MKDHDEILIKIFHLQSQILELGKVSSESLDFLNSTEKKRTQLQQAQKLKDIFNLYWYTFRVFTQTGRNGVLQLTEEGYTKFHVLLQFGLHGNKDIDDAWFNAEIDYRHDSLAYGIISELEFYDILQNLLEEAVAVITVRDSPQSSGVPSVVNAIVSPTASGAGRTEALDLANQSLLRLINLVQEIFQS